MSKISETFSHLIIQLDEGGWDELIKTFKSSSHIEKCPMIMNCVNRMKSMLGDCLPFCAILSDESSFISKHIVLNPWMLVFGYRQKREKTPRYNLAKEDTFLVSFTKVFIRPLNT